MSFWLFSLQRSASTTRSIYANGFQTHRFGSRLLGKQLNNSINRLLSNKKTLVSSSITSTINTESGTEQQLENTTIIWESLESKFSSSIKEEEETQEPVLTLYRDTNGWCPFCERVWVCIRAKNLPYQERLIALFDKPDWYKEMVPTTQVPAVLFHQWGNGNDNHNGNDNGVKNSRKLVWESLDIMNALDEAFPDTIQLVHDTPKYKAAEEQIDRVTKAGFAFIYGARQSANATSSDDTNGNDSNGNNVSIDLKEQLENKKAEFILALDELEKSLKESGGPFRLGSEFTGIDAIMIPVLERWRYQLPLKSDTMAIDILKDRPYLQNWFKAMEDFQPYSGRVMGDEYSWTATNAMFVKYFGGTEEEVKKSEDAATTLLLSSINKSTSTSECEEKFAMEAAKKILSNHNAIVKDCINSNPKSQIYILRSQSEDNANALLQFTTEVLLQGNDAIKSTSSLPFPPTLKEMSKEQKIDVSIAAKTIASRLCVPRDMSAPAAKILRTVLMTISDRLLE